jgi:hypothetical protein
MRPPTAAHGRLVKHPPQIIRTLTIPERKGSRKL